MSFIISLAIFVTWCGIFLILLHAVILPALCKTPRIPGYQMEQNYRKISKLRLQYIRWVLSMDPSHVFHYLPCSTEHADAVFFDTDLTISGYESAGIIRIPLSPVDISQLKSQPSATLFSAVASVMLTYLSEDEAALLKKVLEKSGIITEKFQQNCRIIETLTTEKLFSCKVLSGNQQLYFYMSCDETLVNMCSFVQSSEKLEMTPEMRLRAAQGIRLGVKRYHFAMSEGELITYLGSIEPSMKPIPNEYTQESINQLQSEGFTVGYVDSAGVYLNSDKYNLERDVSLLADSICFLKEFRGNSPFCCTLKPVRTSGSKKPLTSPWKAVHTLIDHDVSASRIQSSIIAIFLPVLTASAFCRSWLLPLVLLLPVCLLVLSFSKRDFHKSQPIPRLKLFLSAAAVCVAAAVLTAVAPYFVQTDLRVAAFSWFIGFCPAIGCLLMQLSGMNHDRLKSLLCSLGAALMIGVVAMIFLSRSSLILCGISLVLGFAGSVSYFLLFREFR